MKTQACDTHRRVSHSSLLALTLSAAQLVCAAGSTSAQHAGWLGPSYAGSETVPTGSKPQSKLWWNDGNWWGCLWSESAQSFMIHRLALQTQTWLDTGTAVDSRPKSRADCLWDGAKLFIASHQYTDGVGTAGHALQLYRYSFDPNADRYSLDVGFPTLIGDAKTEALVIDKDSTGTLWAVWMAGLRVWTAHTLGDDRSWSAPIVHPRSTSDLDEDDLASIVSFGPGTGPRAARMDDTSADTSGSFRGPMIGVLWSDQVRDAFQFSFHVDGTPATSWSTPETVFAGPGIADDDLCLRAARDGRVFAALQTHTDETWLGVRSLVGAWSLHRVATDQDNWCHPIVMLDEEERTVHVFGTTPVAIGAIHEKTSSMDAISFAAGSGTPVIREAGNPAVDEASSTKQSVSGATGLVVLASHEMWQRYVHHHDSLGGNPSSVPVAVFHADAREGFRPVTVQFHDASTGRPTAWLWNFGDGGTSTQRHPVHTYALPGRYTVSLRVSNALGTATLRHPRLVDVEAPPSTLVLRPIGDGHAFEGQPDSNRGGLDFIRARGGRELDYRGFLKFFVPPSQSLITSAELRLACVVGSQDGGTLRLVNDGWEEPTLTWNDMPVLDGPSLGNFGEADPGETVAMDVGSVVDASGTVSFGIESSSFHSVSYCSRQGEAPPELWLELSQGLSAALQAGFEANRRVGRAPLTVQFADASNGRVDSWAWDFGDGSTSDLQNPSHVYRQPGRYSVSLTVSSASGAHTLTGPDPIRVLPRDLTAH